MSNAKVYLIGAPTDATWMEVKHRAIVTQGFTSVKTAPDSAWKHAMLDARHSVIRHLMYNYLLIGIPSNIATHFSRHVHAQPYISTLRNDRQDWVDGDMAPRNTPVNMILDVNAEELMTMANKRLCNLAAKETRWVMAEMCRLAESATPEFDGLLISMCEFRGGVCHEYKGCGFRQNAVNPWKYRDYE